MDNYTFLYCFTTVFGVDLALAEEMPDQYEDGDWCFGELQNDQPLANALNLITLGAVCIYDEMDEVRETTEVTDVIGIVSQVAEATYDEIATKFKGAFGFVAEEVLRYVTFNGALGGKMLWNFIAHLLLTGVNMVYDSQDDYFIDPVYGEPRVAEIGIWSASNVTRKMAKEYSWRLGNNPTVTAIIDDVSWTGWNVKNDVIDATFSHFTTTLSTNNWVVTV